MKIRIVADSSADLITLEDKSVVSVPLKIRTDNKEYVDDESLDIKGMTDDLAAYRGKSGSACPGVGDWLDAFEDADRVFCITITSNLSGSYNSAMVAKEMYESENPDKKVCVIDSLSTGPEMRLIADKIRELLAAGKDYEEICEAIAEYQKSTYLVFMLKSLTNLANNGRVSPAVAKIAGVLGIHVVGIASEVGTLEQKAKSRGEKKGILAVWKQMKELGYKGGKVIIHHCFNLEAAKQLKEMITSEFANADVVIGVTKGLCSFYAEQGGMLVGIEC
jgi:DegV family protein with EDD domain